jgi:RNA polymerase sigma-32 factor
LIRAVARAVADASHEGRARERALIAERLLTERPVPLRELGTRFGVTRERMRQIERALLGDPGQRLSPVAA